MQISDNNKEKAIKRVAEIGVNNIHIRPISFKGWGILHQLDMFHAETVFFAETEEECRDIVRCAIQESF